MTWWDRLDGWKTLGWNLLVLATGIATDLIHALGPEKERMPERFWTALIFIAVAGNIVIRHVTEHRAAWRRRKTKEDGMKKIGIWFWVLVLFMAFLLTAPAFAQDPPAMAEDIAQREIYTLQRPWSFHLGTGHIWTGNGDAARSVNTAEAQVRMGMAWRISEHFSFTFDVTRDGADVTDWLYEHRFRDEPTTFEYHYTVIDAGARYTFNPGDQAEIYGMLGASYFTTGDEQQGGFYAGLGLQYALADSVFVYTEVKYRHVQGFLVPVANVCETGIGIGYRF